MNIKHLILFCLLYAVSTTVFAAGGIHIDCKGGPSWSGTSNKITYSYYLTNGTWHSYQLNGPTNGRCEDDDTWQAGFSSSGMGYGSFRISIDGDDAFWIDRILYSVHGEDDVWFGRNNDKGWVLSTDPADGDTYYAPEGYASSCWEFNPWTHTVYPC